MQKFHLSFCSPLHGRLQLQGWGLATGAGQAGSSLIPHPLPRAEVVPGGPGRGRAGRMLCRRRRHHCQAGGGGGQPKALLYDLAP